MYLVPSQSIAYYHGRMDIPPVSNDLARATLLLGLSVPVRAVLAWHRRHRPVPPEPDHDVALPGSRGEHQLQRHAGSQDRAHRFYRQQVLGRLNERMVEFIGRQEAASLGAD
jgi:hypothetical protein